MPFSELIKKEAREKAGYACCLCHKPSMSIEVHHIVPQEKDDPDTPDNAAAVCPNCHSDFGDNPEKIKRIREMRDWWYEQVKNLYSREETNLIKKISVDLLDIKDNLPDIKNTLYEFAK